MNKERLRIEQEMKAKLEEERREFLRTMDDKQREAEELKLQLEQVQVEKDRIVPDLNDGTKEANE
jgi:hypothetical protein